MADLIDRDALLKDMGLTDAVKYGNKDAEQQYHSYSTMMLYEIADAIWDAPAVNRWIPCSECLPEVYEKVLTYNDEGIIHDNFRLNLRDGSVGWSQGWGITHWQPRPEPPKGGAGNVNG